jgi:flagellar protein FlaI
MVKKKKRNNQEKEGIEKIYESLFKPSEKKEEKGHLDLKERYEALQEFFTHLFEREKKNKNRKNVKLLKKVKKNISKKVKNFKRKPHKPEDLHEEIKKSEKILKSVKNGEEIKTKVSPPQIQYIEKPKKIPRKKGEILEKYEIEAEGAKVNVEIIKNKLGTSYQIYIPEIGLPTNMLLAEMRNELIEITSISMQELTNIKSFASIKERFVKAATEVIAKKLPNLDKETENFLVGHLIQEMLGLGRIEFLIKDPNLEEIVIPSSKEPVRVFFKGYGWLETNIQMKDEDEIINYSNIIARRVGRQINVLNPLLDAHLVTGDRINAVLYPINTKGNTITIRKFARDPFTIIDLISNKTCSLDTAALIWLAIEYEMNVIISGGTASGKTVFLNACMPFIPPNQRVLSIEDTRELMLPKFLYWNPLVTRTPNPEGKGEVKMIDLLINSLRMRPDRIILGEMRKHEEAMVLFEAMHTGHSVYATLHADSATETISRLVNPPLNVPSNLLKAVNLNIIMFRDRKRGIRRVLQVAEIEAEGNEAKANILYRWVPETDSIETLNESTSFFEDLSRNTGMNDIQINKTLEERKNILNWLIKNKIRDLESFGRVMNYYYRNKNLLLDAIKKNKPRLILAKKE